MNFAPETQGPLQGVGGWLLFFVVASFVMLIIEVGELRQFVSVLRIFGFLAVDAILFLCIHVGVLVFFAYALSRVAMEKRNAVRLMKRALVLYGLIGMGAPVISFALSRVVGDFDLVTWGDVIDSYRDIKWSDPALRATAYSIVWFIYFCVSTRVKNTWPETRREPPESVFS